jgi:hypothetical protein
VLTAWKPYNRLTKSALNELADRLAKLRCRVLRESPKLPDLARTTRTYGELLAAVYSLDLSPDDRTRIDAAAKALSPEDQSLAAYRLRGIRGTAVRHRYQRFLPEAPKPATETLEDGCSNFPPPAFAAAPVWVRQRASHRSLNWGFGAELIAEPANFGIALSPIWSVRLP